MFDRRHGGRRLTSLLVVVALVTVACSGSADDALGVGDGSTTTVASPGGTLPKESGVTNATAPRGGTGAGGATGSPAGSGSSGGSPSTTAPPAVIGVGSLGIGGVAPALLRPGRGDRVVLEVRAQAGAEPTSATINHLVDVLRAASGKQVVVDGTDRLDGGGQDWTQRQIIETAAGAAEAESGRVQVVLRLLFLRGSYEGNDSVLGIAVAGDVAAVFSDRVDSAAGLLIAPSVVEDAVSMHEIGHLLALVDLVVGSGRGDPDHPGHSRNERSVMYWQVESDLITQLLDGGIPRDFDDDDRAELAQIRNG